MNYDPIKDIFAGTIKKIPELRIFFYKLLDLFFLRSWYVRRELKNIRKQTNKNLNIYDAGSGFGQYTYFIHKKLQPCLIYSIDVKKEWINDCKEFFKSQKINDVTFGFEDLTQIKHQNKFDLILSVDVMEHIEDDRKVFQNFYNSLKDGGYLLINTPSLYGGSDVHDDVGESFIGEHARDGYSPKDLKDKLEPLGFKIQNIRFTYGFWGDKAWRLGIKTPMKLLNFSKLFFLLLPFYFLITFPFTFVMMFLDYKKNNKIGSGINLIAKKNIKNFNS